jgi:hypothetical protein
MWQGSGRRIGPHPVPDPQQRGPHGLNQGSPIDSREDRRVHDAKCLVESRGGVGSSVGVSRAALTACSRCATLSVTQRGAALHFRIVQVA